MEFAKRDVTLTNYARSRVRRPASVSNNKSAIFEHFHSSIQKPSVVRRISSLLVTRIRFIYIRLRLTLVNAIEFELHRSVKSGSWYRLERYVKMIINKYFVRYTLFDSIKLHTCVHTFQKRYESRRAHRNNFRADSFELPRSAESRAL